MTCASEYAPQLRSLGFRVTNQRMAVLHALRHSQGHVSPGEVYVEAVRSLPSLTQPTVYRTLEFLARAGLVWRANLEKGHLAYELAKGHQHHHLVCRRCGQQTHVGQALIERAYKDVEEVSGYQIDHDHVRLSGLCPECRSKSSIARDRSNVHKVR